MDALRKAAQDVFDALDAMGDAADRDVSPYIWKKVGAQEKLDALRTALAQPAAPDAQPVAWQPIETMPEDGGSYLVADAVRGMVAPRIRGVIHNNPGTAHDWQYGEAITHWMPLPPAPGAAQAAQPAPQPLTTEHHIALREAHAIGASDAYFKAWPTHDNDAGRMLFERGFVRGFDCHYRIAAAGITAAPTTDKKE
jgi:hypothetical protein